MSKKITFDSGGFPRFSDDGEYETDLNTNRVDRFYLDGETLKDKHLGKTDEEIEEIELAEREDTLAALAAIDAELAANKASNQ